MSEEGQIPGYPDKPDRRGVARFQYRGQQVNLGEHGSARSHSLYGWWRRILDETGVAPDLRDARIQIDQDNPSLTYEQQQRRSLRDRVRMVTYCLATFLLGCFTLHCYHHANWAESDHDRNSALVERYHSVEQRQSDREVNLREKEREFSTKLAVWSDGGVCDGIVMSERELSEVRGLRRFQVIRQRVEQRRREDPDLRLLNETMREVQEENLLAWSNEIIEETGLSPTLPTDGAEISRRLQERFRDEALRRIAASGGDAESDKGKEVEDDSFPADAQVR